METRSSGLQRILNFGERQVPDSSDYLHFEGHMNSGGKYCTLRLIGNNSGYQVPAGKTLKLFGFWGYCKADNSEVSFYSGNQDIGIEANAGPSTSYFNTGEIKYSNKPLLPNREYTGHLIEVEVAAGDYPQVYGDASVGDIQVHVVGILEDV